MCSSGAAGEPTDVDEASHIEWYHSPAPPSFCTVFGSPRDVTLDEIAIETFFPADDATRAALQALADGGSATSVGPPRVQQDPGGVAGLAGRLG